jgi:hypothetical protein
MPKKEKIILEMLSGNSSGVMEGLLSVDIAEVERIECKENCCHLYFPGVNISVPLSFCDKIRDVIDAAKAQKK